MGTCTLWVPLHEIEYAGSKAGELITLDKVNNHLIAVLAKIMLMTKTLRTNPYKTLATVLGHFTYVEQKHEKVAEEWLKKVARSKQ